ncbi:MAG: hypothetical protein IKU57_05240 [Oscillospiraceae bacterium]|nr:hypothetical protein [Oscillospiraceae bacterium]
MTRYLYYGLLLARICLLAISLGGYLLHLRKKMPVALAVGLLFAGIGSTMFVAGILHILQETAWLIFAVGLYLAVQQAKKWDRKTCVRYFQEGGDGFFPLLFLTAVALFFGALLFHSEFTHYDNFSHWGVVTKIISQKDMFPNASDTNLTFTSYPLGSASFIYYVTEIIGSSAEWLQMWAQAMLMAGMLAGLFVFGKGMACRIMVCAGIVVLLSSNISFVDLLVDTLLPVTAIGAMAFCIYYKKDLQKQLHFVIPYVIFLVSIKNSGALFALLILGFALFSIPRTKESLKAWLVAALSPVAVTFFWNKHVEQIFDGGAVSKHAMRMDNFQQVVAEKTPADLMAIVGAFGNSIARSFQPVLYLLLLGWFLLLLRRFVFRKDCTELRGILRFAGISYLLYQLGLLGMYILTMPLGEALDMAGYERYHQTILQFVSGLLLIAAIREIHSAGKGTGQCVKGALLASCLLVGITAALQPNLEYYTRQSLRNTEREKYDRLIDDYALWEKETYLILVDEDRDDDGYLYYMTQYLLAPKDVAFASASTVSELADRKFDFVILFDDTQSNRAYLSDQFGLTEEVGYIGDKSLN